MENIRTRITIFVIGNSLSIILILFFLNYFSVAKPLTKEYREKGVIATKKLTRKLDHWITLKEFGLEKLARAIEVYNRVDVPLFTKLIRNAQMVSITESDRKPYICFEDGTWVDGENWNPPFEYLCTSRPWYKGAMENKNFFISGVYIDAQTTQPILTISHKLKLQNGFVGVLGHDFSIKKFTDTLNQLEIMKNSYAFLVDNSSNIIAHPNEEYLYNKETGYKKINKVSNGAFKSAWENPNQSLEKRTVTDYDNKKRVLFFHDIPSYNGKIGMAIAYNEIMAPIKRSIFFSLVSIVIVLVFAVFFAFRLSSGIGKPILETAASADKIANLDFTVTIPPDLLRRKDEIGKLAKSFSKMRKGLLNFKRYVPSDLVNQLIANNQDARIGGIKKELTIFFFAIDNFTYVSKEMSPEELITQLSDYFSEMSQTILDNKGTVDKYIRDTIMAFWGAPNELKNHEFLACQSALRCNELVKELSDKWEKEGKPRFKTRIGINTGEVLVGNIGYEKRIDYTIIGDNVNLASRLESINKYYNTEIIVSETTRDKVKEQFEFRIIDKISVKGKENPILIYELLAEKGKLDKGDLELYQMYNEGINYYFDGNWKKAIEYMDTLMDNKDDSPALLIKLRAENYLRRTPENWDGVFTFQKK